MKIVFGILLLVIANLFNATSLTDVTYEELEELDAVCDNLDNCKLPRKLGDDSLMTHTCHCDHLCSKLDTCCIDSPYRGLTANTAKPSCRAPFGQELLYFMVDKCPSGTSQDIRDKCQREWNEMDDDLISHLPVTSLFSSMTYKNYFCFRCYEEHVEYLYWNIILLSFEEKQNKSINDDDIIPIYDRELNSWIAPIGENGSMIPITLQSKIPEKIENISKVCLPNVISICSRKWKDNEIRRKCGMYTSFVNFLKNDTLIRYKNPHCALCNFENLDAMGCTESPKRTVAKKPFSFALLLDINRSDGDKVGKIDKCDSNSTWDPFFKKCRAFKCAIAGRVIKDGKCESA